VVVLAVAVSAAITDATTSEGADAALVGLSLSYALQVHLICFIPTNMCSFLSNLIDHLCVFPNSLRAI